jgi:two-component system, OmpR family, KDP operon response regulator KdpE
MGYTPSVRLRPGNGSLLVAISKYDAELVTSVGANYIDQTHYLRVSMAQLRHKLERDPTRPRLLTTETGSRISIERGGPLAQGF